MQIFLPIDLPSASFCHILINLYLFTTFIMVQKFCSKGPSHKVNVPDKFNTNLQTTQQSSETKELYYSTYIYNFFQQYKDMVVLVKGNDKYSENEV